MFVATPTSTDLSDARWLFTESRRYYVACKDHLTVESGKLLKVRARVRQNNVMRCSTSDFTYCFWIVRVTGGIILYLRSIFIADVQFTDDFLSFFI